MAFETRKSGSRMVSRKNKRTASTSSRRSTTKRAKREQIKKGRWSVEEDEKLAMLVQLQQRDRKGCKLEDISWDEVEEGFGTRSKKQCRERWISQLDPSLNRGEWTQNEDILLEELALETDKKWANIARKMPGRTENMVKNRFHALQRLRAGGKAPKRKRSKSTSPKTSKSSIAKQPAEPTIVAVEGFGDSSSSADEIIPLSCVTNRGQSKSKSNELVKSDSASSLENFASFGDTLYSPYPPQLTKVPSFDSFIPREVSEPFSDKPDVIVRHPSFDVKGASSGNLMERQFSTDSALWGKVPVKSPSKASSFDFLSSMNKLDRPAMTFDLKKLDGRQRSFGHVSSTDLDQFFFSDQLEVMNGGNNKQ